MILAIGIDIVDVARIEQVIDRQGQRFIDRVFTDGESAYCRSHTRPAVHFAGRFAAKEAAMKALGTGWGDGVSWRDVEVPQTDGAPPRLVLHGRAAERAAALGAIRCHVSISHSGGLAVAQAILERD